MVNRIQLTLFIGKDYSAEIEKIRKEFNPLQYSLIKSHVTLCRENDLVHIEKVIQNLERQEYRPVIIQFGDAVNKGSFRMGEGVDPPKRQQ